MPGNELIMHLVPIISWSGVTKVDAIRITIPQRKSLVYVTAAFYCSLFHNLQLIISIRWRQKQGTGRDLWIRVLHCSSSFWETHAAANDECQLLSFQQIWTCLLCPKIKSFSLRDKPREKLQSFDKSKNMFECNGQLNFQ